MGMTYDDIAHEVGMAGASSAYRAVQRILANTHREASDELVMMDTERLNQMLLTLWPKVLDPDSPEHLSAIREARSVMADIRAINGAGAEQTNVNIQLSTGDTIIIEGDQDSYLAGLQKMAAALGIVDQPAELTVGGDGEIEITDAELIPAHTAHTNGRKKESK